jgi:hypothetical protein
VAGKFVNGRARETTTVLFKEFSRLDFYEEGKKNLMFVSLEGGREVDRRIAIT